jgi:hypothetical protein
MILNTLFIRDGEDDLYQKISTAKLFMKEISLQSISGKTKYFMFVINELCRKKKGITARNIFSYVL